MGDCPWPFPPGWCTSQPIPGPSAPTHSTESSQRPVLSPSSSSSAAANPTDTDTPPLPSSSSSSNDTPSAPTSSLPGDVDTTTSILASTTSSYASSGSFSSDTGASSQPSDTEAVPLSSLGTSAPQSGIPAPTDSANANSTSSFATPPMSSGFTGTTLPGTTGITSLPSSPAAVSAATGTHKNYAGAIAGGIIGGLLGLLLFVGLAFIVRRKQRKRRMAPSAEFMAIVPSSGPAMDSHLPLARQMSIDDMSEAPPPFTGSFDPVYEKVRAAAVQHEPYRDYSAMGGPSEKGDYLEGKEGYLQ